MKDLTLIAFLLLIASGYFMRQQYPYLTDQNETKLKMFSDKDSLMDFYQDSLHFKRNEVCNVCIPFHYELIKEKLRNCYIADFLFLICYSFLFWIIAWYLANNSGGFYLKYRSILVAIIALTFFADVGENIIMLKYIASNFEDYFSLIRILNIVKVCGFVVLIYLLVIRKPILVLQGFTKCIQ